MTLSFLISNHCSTVCFLRIKICERLTIPVFPRLKVSIRIVSGTSVYEFDLITDICGLDWMSVVNIQIGLDWVWKNGPMSNSVPVCWRNYKWEERRFKNLCPNV